MNDLFLILEDNVPEGFEFMELGEGQIIKELKNNVLFCGTLSEWAAFKKHHPEMLTGDQLSKEIV